MALAFGTPVEDFSSTAGTSHTQNLSTANTGDLRILAIAANPDGTGTRGTLTLPSGWTWIGTATETGAASTGELAHIGRIVQGGDGTTLALTYNNSVMVASICVTVTGHDSGTWLDQTVPTYTTGSSPPVSPTITTQTDDAAVVCACNIDGAPTFGDGDIPSGFTLLGTMVNNPPSNGQNLGFAYIIQATAGASGTKSWTNGGSEEYVASTFAIRPAAVGISSVTPDEFDMDDADVDVASTGGVFDASANDVYLSQHDTLAGGTTEVDIGSAINTESTTLINLDLTQLSAAELADLHTLGPGARFVIVDATGGEYSYPVTLHRPEAFKMSLGAGTPGASTARLTAPATKTTGDFDAGRFEEAANPATTVNITTDNYTEMVYSIEAKLLAREVSYDFRITPVGGVINDYTVTPQVTISGFSTETTTTSIDALIQTVGQLKSTTIDSLLQKNVPITLSFDGLLSMLQTIQANMDAQLWQNLTQTLTIDSLLERIGVETSLSVDALLSEHHTRLLSIDALLEKIGLTTGTTLDGLLKKGGLTAASTIDALISKSQHHTLSLDAVLYVLGGGTVETSLDALLNKVGLTSATTIDALLEVSGLTVGSTVDALLQSAGLTSTTTIDALLQKIGTTTASLDAILYGPAAVVYDLTLRLAETAEVTLDALLKKIGTSTLSLDAILYVLGSGTADTSLDSMLQQLGIDSTTTLDSLLQKSGLTSSSTLDALLRGNVQTTTTLDAILYSLVAGQIYTSLDALLKQSDVTTTLSIDALLKAIGLPVNATLDALLQAAGFTKIVTLDSLLQQTGLTSSTTLDALLKAIGVESTSTLDAILYSLIAGGIETSLDALLNQSSVSTTLSIDALLQTAGLTVDTTLDALLQGLGYTATLSLDAVLNKVGITTGLSLDAILYILGVGTEQVSLDALLSKSGLISTLAIDSLLQRTVQDTTELDALLIKSITQSLTMDALAQKSGQTETTNIDASLYFLNTVSTTIDAVLRLINVAATLLDAVLLQLGVTSTAVLDALLYQGRILNLSIDAITQKTLARTVDMDALLRGEVTSSTLLDAIIHSVLNSRIEIISTLTRPAFVEVVENLDGFVTTIERPSFIFDA